MVPKFTITLNKIQKDWRSFPGYFFPSLSFGNFLLPIFHSIHLEVNYINWLHFPILFFVKLQSESPSRKRRRMSHGGVELATSPSPPLVRPWQTPPNQIAASLQHRSMATSVTTNTNQRYNSQSSGDWCNNSGRRSNGRRRWEFIHIFKFLEKVFGQLYRTKS